MQKTTNNIPAATTPCFYIMNDGEFVNLQGYVIDTHGNVFREIGDDFFLVPQNIDHNGYFLVNIANPRLATVTGYRSIYIQRLMMCSFYGDEWFPTAQADHIDADKKNNELSNLQWLSAADNTRKARNIAIVVTDLQDGSETLCDSMTNAATFIGINVSTIYNMLKGMNTRVITHTVRLA